MDIENNFWWLSDNADKIARLYGKAHGYRTKRQGGGQIYNKEGRIIARSWKELWEVVGGARIKKWVAETYGIKEVAHKTAGELWGEMHRR